MQCVPCWCDIMYQVNLCNACRVVGVILCIRPICTMCDMLCKLVCQADLCNVCHVGVILCTRSICALRVL